MGEIVRKIPLELLEFDPCNPRLPRMVRGGTQEEIEEFLGMAMIPDRLVGSIVMNGLLESMPILVAELEDGKYQVKDGNRRLVAVRAFTYDVLPKWLHGNVRDAVASSDFVPDGMYATVVGAEDAFGAVGAIHIESPIRWELEQRNRYLARLFDRTEGELEERLCKVSLSVGLDTRLVLRSLNMMRIWEYALENDHFGLLEAKEFSSVFPIWNAVGDHRIQKFLGMRGNGRTACLRDDFDSLHERVRELWGYLYGDLMGVGGGMISDRDGDIEKLGVVLDDEDARACLKEHGDLVMAYQMTSESYENLRGLLREAIGTLRRAGTHAERMTSDFDESGELIANAEAELLRLGQAIVRSKFEQGS